jgi:hypothetical protein
LELPIPLEPLSRAIPGLRGRSTVYIDESGYVYYQHSIRGSIRLVMENIRHIIISTLI